MEKGDMEISLEMKSEEVQEVMGQTPSWIVRWGIILFSFIVMMLLMGSYLFKYPDTVQSQIVITPDDPPANVIARSTGKLDEIFVINNQLIEEGEPLAVIQNPATTSDMLRLATVLKEMESSATDPTGAYNLVTGESYGLGVIQPAFNAFVKAINDYKNFDQLNYYKRKITYQRQQLVLQEEAYSEMLNQIPLTGESYKTSKAIFERDSILHLKRVISDNEFDLSKQVYIQEGRTHSNFHSSLKQQELQISKSSENLLDLEREAFDRESTYLIAFQTALNELNAQIRSWEQNFLLSSPVKGKVYLMGPWSKNQNVTSGETIFSIAPAENNTVRGKALLPAQGAGKVKIGQLANIRVDNFPDQEFGYLKGKVISISNSATAEGFYVLELTLINGMKTNYGKLLPLDGEQVGVADIITENIRLLERIFLPLKKILKEQDESL
ncbi:HlyD family efflux transporter periplasmic adaptor subunit [Parapedobacter tibetensis]|uniref:HlyD family efflux transporter periplasmic adaptor subunit n=1 Tax=Parapedobacter tibetensis TaxID=2972951 RepID=UPI00214D2E6A|nr:HlyD family efflux transporter periplasmic adaptor subunit [Parapedobacter tibetensis]